MKILIDNGHGLDTAGKRSPDGAYREALWARSMAKRLREKLTRAPYNFRPEDIVLLVPEQTDIPLTTRARRANVYGRDSLLVSLHSNAAGNGKWMNARGWSIYTSPGKTKADTLATYIYEAAKQHLAPYGVTFRSDTTDGDPDYEARFTILTATVMPAVLTENLFHDNREDVALLQDPKVQDAIATAHADGILRYCKEQAAK